MAYVGLHTEDVEMPPGAMRRQMPSADDRAAAAAADRWQITVIGSTILGWLLWLLRCRCCKKLIIAFTLASICRNQSVPTLLVSTVYSAYRPRPRAQTLHFGDDGQTTISN